MNRILPWTLVMLLTCMVIVGSVALAQWEPLGHEPVKWFTPPPILESDLDPDLVDQEVCYMVLKVAGKHMPFEYTIRPHFDNKKDEWYLFPVVIEAQRRSVWRTLQAILDTNEEER
jgi:hypothetical protein